MAFVVIGCGVTEMILIPSIVDNVLSTKEITRQYELLKTTFVDDDKSPNLILRSISFIFDDSARHCCSWRLFFDNCENKIDLKRIKSLMQKKSSNIASVISVQLVLQENSNQFICVHLANVNDGSSSSSTTGGAL